MSIYDVTARHSYDIVAYVLPRGQFVTINLWASGVKRAQDRAIQELGGEGVVQVLSCERMVTDKCSSSVRKLFDVASA